MILALLALLSCQPSTDVMGLTYFKVSISCQDFNGGSYVGTDPILDEVPSIIQRTDYGYTEDGTAVSMTYSGSYQFAVFPDGSWEILGGCLGDNAIATQGYGSVPIDGITLVIGVESSR